ncbi:glycosyltransferase family 2 protein [Coralloluteibacterium stylophorae]|uniref:Glycosyltransferase family 2 protein n=1 Tax=Coralloluteibacterium stylophorae TaxID=1776034 RepID=A0A8J8AX25_9GAMM|nr:glycosyltransferase family 2 protein [Coralloluteibacterium stylophorae]
MTSSPDPAAGGAIDVVVVTYRSASTIEACLRRVLAAEDVAAAIVVDNASDDGTRDRVAAVGMDDARLRPWANTANVGFGSACNQGAAMGDSPWIALVNPDLMLEPDTLSRLRAHMEADPGLGLVGADLVDEVGVRDGAARRREPTLAAMLGGARALALAPTDAALQAVDAASGALMLMPRALYAALGGFDEGYRLHAEDLDLCRRVRDAGRRVAVANDVRVLHVRGVSSRSRPLFVEWHKHRGLWRYFVKFEGRGVGALRRAFAFVAIWGHFGLILPRQLLRAVRG